MAEHFFVQRSRPPLDHAAFVHQAAAKFGQGAALGENFAVHHLVQCNTESLTLFDQHLDMAGNARVYQLIADFADVGRQQLPVACKKALVPLVNDQVKIIDLHRIAVPVLPEQTNGVHWELAGFEITHERSAENPFIPARVHAVLDLVGEGFRVGGRKPLADFQSERPMSCAHVPEGYSAAPVFAMPSFNSARSFSVKGAHSQRGKRSTGRPRMRINSPNTPRPWVRKKRPTTCMSLVNRSCSFWAAWRLPAFRASYIFTQVSGNGVDGGGMAPRTPIEEPGVKEKMPPGKTTADLG